MSRNTKIEQATRTRNLLRKKISRVVVTGATLSVMAASMWQMSTQESSQIHYATGTFAEVLSSAGAGDKLCFVSFETEFCYPCASLSQKFAEETEIGQILHTQYKPYRIDPLNSYAGGNAMARMYGITRVPTLLITDSDGKELFRIEEASQWDSLRTLLTAQAALRLPPVKESPSLISKRSSVPLHIARDPVSDVEFEALYSRRFSLSLGRFDSYEEARKMAKAQEKSWNQSIWIQPRGQTYELLIGNFASRKAARMTRRLLQLWENTPTKVTSLRDIPLDLDSSPPLEGPTQP